jgi:aminomethyltransferase
LFEFHKKLGARLVPFAGWEMPVQYEGVSAEHNAVRNAVGIFDVSHMGELMLRGNGAAAVVDSLITNDLSRFAPGSALYTCACNEQGTILDDLIVYKLATDEILVVCNASNLAKMSAHFASHAKGRCDFEDRSAETALISVQGPKAAVLLGQLQPSPVLETVKSFQAQRTNLFGCSVLAGRTGYTGEDGFELFCSNADAPKLWSALLEKGANFGVKPIGLGARDTLRLEARLSLYGNEIDETTHPLEAGLGWVVKLDGRNFLGAEALRRAKAEPPVRTIVGFEMTGRGIARHGYPLLDSTGQVVGVCTSGAPSPTLGKSIGLGYLPVAMSQPGSEFLVDCRGKNISAVVVKTPFYKRPPPR